MRNLTAPKQYTDDKDRTTFDAGTQCLVLYTAAGDAVSIRVDTDGWLYVNDIPFGVYGMPPAPHKQTHAADGADAITPALIGAADAVATADAIDAANANADSRVLQTVYESDIASILARLSTLEASAVQSTNIATITGTELPEGGVAYIEYTPRESE